MDYYFRDFIPDDYKKVLSLWDETGISNPKRGDTLEMIEKTITSAEKMIIMTMKPDMQIIGASDYQ
ncbi:MAG: hypothetical protein MZU84_07495 [Sphingobacterium sp.]|nr:hypothetical protein [Sphingobacterium sp.]